MDRPFGTTLLTKEQKTGVALLGVFGILAVTLGMLQLRNTIYNPFAPKEVTQIEEDFSSLFSDSSARLQQLDTDNDGLSDYDEMSFHNTSAYIPDTDSDGIGDKEEVAAGSDPLCPEGITCAALEAAPTRAPSSTAGSPLAPVSEPEPLNTAPVAQPPSAPTLSAAEINTLLQDPATLRKILVEGGQMTAAEAAAIDDATLLRAARESYARSTASSTPNSP